MVSNNCTASSQRRLIAAVTMCTAFLIAAGCATAPVVTVTQATLEVGETPVAVWVHHRETSAPTMLNLHDDENTSVAAGQIVLASGGGRLIELRHDGKRLISFQLNGATYRFDPNRIFSDPGIEATLSRTGNYSAPAQTAVRQFATDLVTRFRLDQEPVILALHNTGRRGLSIESYEPKGDLHAAATGVHISTNRFGGDFFYVTDPRFFDYLSQLDFNVILQDDANVPDDGSASVYFARRGIPYVNIEADRDHLTEQIEMVRFAHKMVHELGLTQ